MLSHHPSRLLNYGIRIHILFSLLWFGFSNERAKSRTEGLHPLAQQVSVEKIRDSNLFTRKYRGQKSIFGFLVGSYAAKPHNYTKGPGTGLKCKKMGQH